MARIRVTRLSTLPPGSIIQVDIGQDAYAVCNSGGEIHALDGICPHAGGPLGQGALHGSTIVCPWHAWEYDCQTGACDFNGEIKLQKFPVTIVDDDVWIDV